MRLTVLLNFTQVCCCDVVELSTKAGEKSFESSPIDWLEPFRNIQVNKPQAKSYANGHLTSHRPAVISPAKINATVAQTLASPPTLQADRSVALCVTTISAISSSSTVRRQISQVAQMGDGARKYGFLQDMFLVVLAVRQIFFPHMSCVNHDRMCPYIILAERSCKTCRWRQIRRRKPTTKQE